MSLKLIAQWTAAVAVVLVAVAVIAPHIGGTTVEYWSSVPTQREEYIKAAADLGYSAKEVVNTDGQTVLQLKHVSEADSRALECRSLSSDAGRSLPPPQELVERMHNVCAL